MIEARGLGRSYGDRVAVQGLDLSVAPGEIVGLLGPNGAGKTTTLRMLVGALAPTEGTVRIDGVDLLEEPLKARARVGYLPEIAPIPEDASVREALVHVARLHRIPHAAAAAEAALDRFDLREVQARLVGHLSKGWRQRTALATALVHQPRAVVLDEPSSGLDPGQRVEMRARVRALADAGAAVLLSTHALSEVAATCDRVAVLHHGRLALEGRVDALTGRGATRLVVERPEGVEAALAAVPGVTGVEARGEAWVVRGGARPALAAAAAPFGLVELGRADDLEAVFLAATGAHA